MIRVNIYLPDKLLAALRAMSAEDGVKVAEHVRRALAVYVKKEKK